MSDWEIVTPAKGSVSVGPTPDGWEKLQAKPETAYDRFLNAIEIPKMGGVSPVVGPMVASGTGELIKGAGALTELAFPETGRNISRLGEKITGEVKEQYPVSGTVGQIGSYAVPYSAAQKAINVAKAVPQVASRIANIGKIPSFALASGEQAAIGGGTGYALTPDSENRNQAALYGAVFGGATPAIGGAFNKTAEFLRGRPASPQMIQNVQAGQEAGYVIPPTQVKPSLFNRLLEGTAGKLTTAQNASFANQEVTNNLAKKALGMANDTPLTFENLDNILDTYFDDIINNKIIVHYLKEQEHIQDHIQEHIQEYVLNQDEDNPEWSIKQKIPFDGFAICNIFIADIYCKFHLHIHNYSKNNKLPELPEQVLYFYLVTKNINIIMDNICKIYRKDVTPRPINRAAILRGRR
jgi:hypothetical protein